MVIPWTDFCQNTKSWKGHSVTFSVLWSSLLLPYRMVIIGNNMLCQYMGFINHNFEYPVPYGTVRSLILKKYLLCYVIVPYVNISWYLLSVLIFDICYVYFWYIPTYVRLKLWNIFPVTVETVHRLY